MEGYLGLQGGVRLRGYERSNCKRETGRDLFNGRAI